ncbi:MAG TPA: TonB family protein [Burkholderiales bacterium]|nr:TonB family protein [Burkholderiales bacterium]
MQAAIATGVFRPPDFWVRSDPQTRVLYVSVGISLLLHGIVLATHFRFPESVRWRSANEPLEVALVNAKTRDKPVQADVLAQANLDRGGNTEQDRHAKTSLPKTSPRHPGKDLAAAQRRQRQLEHQQRRLLAEAQKQRVETPTTERRAPADDPAPQASGRDLADLSLAAMKLQAQIDRRIEEYEKRPRKQFIGARATEYRFAQYEEDWRQKVERIGTINYPAEARGKLYGNLRLTVTIRPDGSVDSIELDRSSGLKALDQAAFKIVRMASPFAPFPPDIRKDTDLLVITRTWFFGQGDKIWTE